MAEQNNTHTLYTHYTRLVTKANEDIAQTKKYLDPNSPNYLPTYIANLEKLQQSAQAPAGIADKIATQKANLEAYQARAASARQILAEYPAKIKALEAANHVFRAPPEKEQEYLYVLDEESCKASCVDWDAVAANPGELVITPDTTHYAFKGESVIELLGEQTDAVRIWNHHVRAENLHIVDQRSDNIAHRDAIQLIPPALGKREGNTYLRLADQMAGAIQEGVSVCDCTVEAPNGPLQGIFSSDGMQRQLRLVNNKITTKGSHAISIAGLLDGGEISGNVLYEVKDGEVPRIRLFPARIGGNMADDGVVCILGFAPEEGESHLAYEPVQTNAINQRVRANGQTEPLAIDDERHLIPDNLLKMSVGLSDFHYHAYLADYSSLTLGQFRQKDPFGAQQLDAWLKLRTQEFAQGRDDHNPLGPVSSEQKTIGERFLIPALKAWQSHTAEPIRLVDLEYTAIRSFAMKRLAILHGKVEPLIDIALMNPRRAAMLSFLLPAEQVNEVVRIAQWQALMLCTDTKKPVANARFKLYFEPSAIFEGVTNEQGKVTLSDLPLAPCILEFADSNLFVSPEDKRYSDLATDTVSGLAQGFLADLRRKLPVLESYLSHDPSQEMRCLQALERQLVAAKVQSDQDITPALRRDCLSAIGVTTSLREPYLEVSEFWVQCPLLKASFPPLNQSTYSGGSRQEEGANSEKLGCALALLTAVLKMLGGLRTKKPPNDGGNI
ncbi:prealbumin-like fold domain-containing protein [Thiolinea disciformis]|uniref:prealbumin-like fold domain-containing protein n=1 Tax=Thiolinea disciformis TaxID=125614 RepID=UPI000371C62C|nr:prealbumin-like fold domain-containing protein [Thiolinea disciformis]